MLYAVLGVALFDGFFTQPLRSLMTKIVGSEDVGKVIFPLNLLLVWNLRERKLLKVFAAVGSLWL